MSNGNVGHFLIHVEEEVAKAKTKFPANNFLLPALMEEVGELAQALMEYAKLRDPKRVWPTHKVIPTKKDIYKEAVQVAAMAARIATEGDPHFVDDMRAEP